MVLITSSVKFVTELSRICHEKLIAIVPYKTNVRCQRINRQLFGKVIAHENAERIPLCFKFIEFYLCFYRFGGRIFIVNSTYVCTLLCVIK